MSVETYKKQIIELRAKLDKEKEAKKNDNERYAHYVKTASTPTTKASYRKQKVDHAAAHDRNIADLKRRIDNAKEYLAREKERARKK